MPQVWFQGPADLYTNPYKNKSIRLRGPWVPYTRIDAPEASPNSAAADDIVKLTEDTPHLPQTTTITATAKSHLDSRKV